MNPENPFLSIQTRTFFLWAILGCLALGLLTVAISIPWSLLVLFGNPDTGATTLANPDPVFFLIIFNLWLYGIIALWCWRQVRRSQLKLGQLLGKLPPTQRGLRLLLLVGPMLMFSLGSGQLWIGAIARFFPDFARSVLERNIFLSTGETSTPILYNATVVFFLVAIAPFVEEFFFRGIILQRLATKWGVTAGVIVSSVFFGVLHFNAVGLSVFGIIIALVYLNTRTLWIPIAIHTLNNTIVVVVTLFSGGANLNPSTSNLEQSLSSWRLGLLYVVLSLPFLLAYGYNTWPQKDLALPYWKNAPSTPPMDAIASSEIDCDSPQQEPH